MTERQESILNRVACPKCFSYRGVPCVNEKGRFRKNNHQDRFLLAIEVEEAEQEAWAIHDRP